MAVYFVESSRQLMLYSEFNISWCVHRKGQLVVSISNGITTSHTGCVIIM